MDSDSSRDHPYVTGPLVFGASIGLQIMIAAFMRFGFARGQPFSLSLTPYGRSISAPEYDLPIFVGGLSLALCASLAAAAEWRREVARIGAAERERMARDSALLLGGLGLASLIAFAAMLCTWWFSQDFSTHAEMPIHNRWSTLDSYRLLIPAAMAVACALWDVKFGRGRAAGSSPARADRVALALFPIFIVLVIGVPPARWTELAGIFFVEERLHHLSYFAVGPAMSFEHGRAFGTEIYSQYGIGWAWLLSALSGHVPLGSYGTFIGIEAIYGCLYFCGWFLTLWLVFRRATWAASGASLAIGWQLFNGVGGDNVIWRFPSSVMMRHPMDVWFFLALVLHQQSGRRAWIALAGLAAALGIFFETETGIYLLVTFGLYWLLRFGNALRSGRVAERSALFSELAAFHLTAVAVAVPLLLHASRGTLFSGSFVSGWLEPLIQYGSWGLGAMPISIVPDAALLLFIAMTAIYLYAISHACERSFRGRARDEDVLLAAIGAYGLALLLVFVGRSHPYNLWHASVPFAIALAMLLFRGDRALRRRLPHSSIGAVLCGGLVALLVTNADFRRYPSLLAAPFRDPPKPGLELMSDPVDVTGIPEDAGPFVNGFRSVAEAIREVASDDGEVAIFDGDDTLLYQAAGVAPWSRYASLFTMSVSHRSLDELKRELAERPPRHVVMRTEPAPEFSFVWYPVHEIVESRYALSRTLEGFEIWSWRDDSPDR